VYDRATRAKAIELRASGMTITAISLRLGASRYAIREWLADPERALAPRPREFCFACAETPCPAPAAYAYVLGQYLGDGYLVTSTAVPVLRIFACLDYPGIVDQITMTIARVRGAMPGFIPNHTSSRVVNVQSYWKHWPCVLPQHGPGMKHTRKIALEPWQEAIVAAHPWPLIRGLMHSDGCRTTNNVCVRGKAYSYGRWMFSNESRDILALLGRTLDAVGVQWRYNRPNSISIARRASVALLDEHIGPKS
jgi:hypothetical protein